MQVAVHSPKGGAQRPEQNHDKRGMQHEGVQPMPKPSAHNDPSSREHNARPQQAEEHIAVDVGMAAVLPHRCSTIVAAMSTTTCTARR